MKKIGCLVEWGLDFFLSSRLSKISLRGFLYSGSANQNYLFLREKYKNKIFLGSVVDIYALSIANLND